METEHFDLLVIGGGKAGKSLAMDLAAAGQRVAMVERGMIGGTCINVACIPTKTLVNSARLLAATRRAAEFGIDAGTPAVNLDLLRARKEDVVGTMVAGQRKSFLASGMDLVIGQARFTGPRTVEVVDDAGTPRSLSGTGVVVNTGMVPAVPDIPGLRAAQPLTSTSILTLAELPASIVILGGGYIGCEFASMLSIMGVAVTLVQRGASLLPREDTDVSAAVTSALESDSVSVRLGAAAESVVRTNGTVTVSLADGTTVEAAEVLVALGRKPVTAGLGLEAAGVDLAPGGLVAVDEFLRTTADGVWAAGDVAGTPQFTHASWNDYRILKANLAAVPGVALHSTRDRLIPYCVFTTPELGRVGLSEAQARAAGHDVRIAKMPVTAIPRARTVGQLEGMWKAVVERGTDRILGVSLLGHESSEVIAVVQMAMLGGLPYQQVRDAVIAHPTMAEGLQLLFSDAFLEA
ncbi:pyruvate/2-oxoglutarate dehydrogenase complex dihydrolipoamide dehydrogenase (E3) component [Arthrobacter stackebrandtii]|uniref:Pyruvate/2-oxoglutarate dehydrogenase complex dihydrolipoamide dehydrogenase (E3) component n=1 Tax=Arthrobacter stackebrandtii TaxID=272161 RepID=A0ABS4YX52_9MICC|nr:FAD-dependent oxidoreductase [Arthrobacter stackebrandtii]MBP2413175.1 pyruvate/2-oxoglutarate dehydrogenase complex dihydrolipoamide dehydrogenase (E3) component [Arthrobacter stackebrandtii]PYH01068.1 mercuric reductase [Arthrobacter stackebrandtii]